MSEFVLTNKEDLTAIANAVRASTGSTSTYNVSELSAAAVNVIENGTGGGEAGGYYTPTVSQPNSNTMRMAFSPSKSDMPSVSPVSITLPKGDTPVKGEDYWTDLDQLSIVTDTVNSIEKISAEDVREICGSTVGDLDLIDESYIIEQVNMYSSQQIATELAKRGQLNPEFANDISECIDQSKLYVLPDGYIYAYTYSGEPEQLYTNQFTDEIRQTVVLNKRVNSSHTQVDAAGIVSFAVPITSEQFAAMQATDPFIIRVKGASLVDQNLCRACGLGADGSMHGSGAIVPITTQIIYEEAEDGTLTALDSSSAIDLAKTQCFKLGYVNSTNYDNSTNELSTSKRNEYQYGFTFCLKVNLNGTATKEHLDDIIITFNEPIAFGDAVGYRWVNTGHKLIPVEYESKMKEAEEATASAQAAADGAEAAWAQITKLSNDMDERLAQLVQLEPAYANSIEECTDATKMYVLPDGFIYACMFTEGGARISPTLPTRLVLIG